MHRNIAPLIAVAVASLIIAGCSGENPFEPPAQSQLRPTAPMDAPAIGDLVWHDANMDGIQGDMSGEPGIYGVTVHLFRCTDSVMVAETTTDTMGYYSFEDLSPGDYFLHFVLPEGYAFSPRDMADDSLDSDVDTLTGLTDCISLDSAETEPWWDAGIYPVDEGCTRSKGYWKNHAGLGPQPDMVTDLLPIWLGTDDGDKSMAVTDAQIAVDVLHQHTYGEPRNGITKLYAQLLAAKLNIASGAADDDIAEVIADADDFLAVYDWTDWGNLDKSQKHMVLGWKDMLDDYNNGQIGPGYCGDYDEDDDDDMDDMNGEGVSMTIMPGSVQQN